MKKTKSKVMTIANRLTAQGYSRPAAMVKAWAIVKLGSMETKVAGVTFDKRQQAIQRLAQYDPAAISIRLERERGNVHDRSAVAVYAAVEGKGSYHMGYLPRSLAQFIAPLLDAGKAVQGTFKAIVGGGDAWMNYGLRLEVRA